MRLSVIDVDPGASQGTMLFLHGFGGQALQWKAQVNFFAEDYRIVAPDLRGHGRSDKPHTMYTIDEMLGDLDALLREMHVPAKFTLFGHSFGGAIASVLAARQPERVEKLVLIGTAAEFSLSPLFRLAYYIPTALLRQIMLHYSHHIYSTAYVMKHYYANGLKAWDGSILKQITVPTLVIRGQRDFVFPQAAYGAVAQMVPNAQEVIIPVSAHLVHLERADATNRAIQRFLGPTSTAWRAERERRTATERSLGQAARLIRFSDVANAAAFLGVPEKNLQRWYYDYVERQAQKPPTDLKPIQSLGIDELSLKKSTGSS